MVVELPQGYYRDNFAELIDHVYRQYNDLLSDVELAFYHHFFECDEDAQKLLVRMLTRKGELFRCSKLSYQEINDTAVSAAQLHQKKLININPVVDIEQVLPLFTKAQWLAMLLACGIDSKPLKTLGRADLDNAVIQYAKSHDLLAVISDDIYQLAQPKCFEIFKLLFFGNLRQDMTEYVLRDLGLYRFEPYAMDKATRLFSSREQIEQYLAYYELVSNIDQVMASGVEEILSLHGALPQADESDLTLSRRIQRVNLTLARQLERLEAFDQALKVYRYCELPPSRERQSRILIKQNQITQGLALCREILDQPRGDEEAVFASEFGWRTAKKHKIDWSAPAKYQPDTQIIQLKQSGMGVEVDVAVHLNQFGRCFFVENGLFSSVFGLHYWSLLFAPVRGAFTNPFQTRPHDLYDSHFIGQRQALFERAQARLDNINNNLDEYLALWQEKYGTATPFVYWDLLSEDLLKIAFERIDSSHWQAIFKRLWADLRANRSGFPDLVFFPEAGGYELVEVKGPGDKLQKNQLRWMAYFAEHEIPHRVVHVEWE